MRFLTCFLDGHGSHGLELHRASEDFWYHRVEVRLDFCYSGHYVSTVDLWTQRVPTDISAFFIQVTGAALASGSKQPASTTLRGKLQATSNVEQLIELT